jgi:hypothetical protein
MKSFPIKVELCGKKTRNLVLNLSPSQKEWDIVVRNFEALSTDPFCLSTFKASNK